MAQETKDDLKLDVNEKYQDNIIGRTKNSDINSQQINIIDSNLNLAETDPQTVTGPIDFLEIPTVAGVLIAVGANLVIPVNSIDDFPTPAANVITLADNTTYQISGNIDIGVNTIKFGALSKIGGYNRRTDRITYTGSGNVFEYDGDGGFIMSEFNIVAATGTVFNLVGTAPSTVIIDNCFVFLADKMGTFADVGFSIFRSFSPVGITNATDGGLLFTGAQTSFVMDDSLWQTFTAGKMLDFGTATFDRISIGISNRFVTSTGVTAITGAASNANLNSGGLGLISGNTFQGVGTFLSGWDVQDNLFRYSGNAGIGDSMNDAHITSIGNALATVIPAVNTPTLVNAAFNEESKAKFTTDANGRCTYTGTEDIRIPVIFICSAEPVSGTNKTISSYVAKNGTAIANSKQQMRADNSDPRGLTTATQVEFVTGDYVEPFIENNTDAVNINVLNPKLIVD